MTTSPGSSVNPAEGLSVLVSPSIQLLRIGLSASVQLMRCPGSRGYHSGLGWCTFMWAGFYINKLSFAVCTSDLSGYALKGFWGLWWTQSPPVVHAHFLPLISALVLCCISFLHCLYNQMESTENSTSSIIQ